jgi:hypothetical protein
VTTLNSAQTSHPQHCNQEEPVIIREGTGEIFFTREMAESTPRFRHLQCMERSAWLKNMGSTPAVVSVINWKRTPEAPGYLSFDSLAHGATSLVRWPNEISVKKTSPDPDCRKQGIELQEKS